MFSARSSYTLPIPLSSVLKRDSPLNSEKESIAFLRAILKKSTIILENCNTYPIIARYTWICIKYFYFYFHAVCSNTCV